MRRVWTLQETVQVARDTAQRKRSGLSFATAFKEAQAAMPIDFTRKAGNYGSHTQLGMAFSEEYQRELKGIVKPPSITPAFTAAPTPSVVSTAAESSFDELINELSAAIASRIVEGIQNTLRERVKSIVKGVEPAAVIAAQQRKRSILLVGGLESQTGMLRSEFKELLDITGWTSEQALKLPCTGKYTQVILWADFISHSVSSRLEQEFGKENCVLVRGGVGHLREALEAAFCA